MLNAVRICGLRLSDFDLKGNNFGLSFVDRLGRKPLLITSALSTGLSLFIFGMFTYATSLGYETSEYGWIPIVSFSSMLFAAACGIIPLLTVIISELMPDKVRSLMEYN